MDKTLFKGERWMQRSPLQTHAAIRPLRGA
jgi:hypothetical protein